MIKGTAVTVNRPFPTGTDRFGNAVYGMTGESVPDVLVTPGATSFLDASRPEGASVALTLHFPKEYAKGLEGCTVDLPDPWGGLYKVIGDPKPYMDGNCPTRWNRPVEVEAAHG